MKPTLVLIVSFLATLGAVGAVSTVRQHQSSSAVQSSEPGTLKWHAQKAKAHGKKYIAVATPIYNYAGVRSLDEALTYFDVVIATPVEKKSYVQSSRNITTWYKFKIIDPLHRSSQPGCPICGSLPSPPDEMLPLKEDEILIPKAGGAVVIDGVEVSKVEDGFPQFSLSEEYLLFVDKDSSRGIGSLSMGPYSVFGVNADKTIKHINKKDSPLKSEIEAIYNNSVEQLKVKIKGRK